MPTSATDNNPYSPPKSGLGLDNINREVPSISEALSRGYDFAIGEVLSEAWQRISGCKGAIIGAGLLAYLFMFVISFIFGLIAGLVGAATQNPVIVIAINTLINILSPILIYPFFAGVFLIGIRRAGDYPVSFTMLFSCLAQSGPIMLAALLMSLIIYVPAGLLFGLVWLVAGFSGGAMVFAVLLATIYVIYAGMSYVLTLPLVFERDLSPWQALETSRKAIGQRWFKVFGLMLLLWLLIVVSALPLMIGLIWTIPLMIVVFGVLYRIIFGVLPPAN